MSPHRRLQNLIAFGQTQAALRDDGPTPLVQASFGDLQTLDDMQIIQHFGFSSSAPAGSNVVSLFGAGNKSKGVILGSVAPASRRRMLVTGETVVYDLWGNEVHLGQAGLTIKHATQLTIQVGSMSAVFSSGGLAVTNGTVTSTGDQVAGFGTGDQVAQLTHKHPTAELGSPSSPTPGT